MSEFFEFIFDKDLVHLPHVGGMHTWSNNQASSHLDRFLVSPSCEAHYSIVFLKRLDRVCLDHFPIVLDCEGIYEGERYLKFENMRLKVDSFILLVEIKFVH